MCQRAASVCFLLFLLASPSVALAGSPTFVWHDDLPTAWNSAKSAQRPLLICFQSSGAKSLGGRAAATALSTKGNEKLLLKFTLAQLPLDILTGIQSGESALLEPNEVSELRGKPGLVLIDLEDPMSPFFGRVISIFPFHTKHELTPDRLRVLLTLPRASLTQRTMMLAVRCHPDRPASASGTFHQLLADECLSHSLHQARITKQGHHNWERRFHRINSMLPEGMTAQEVCAESWPNEDLLTAAFECVRCWRTSPGHWSAVGSKQTLFAYDIQRGRDNIWYATGIFARQR